MLFSYHRFKGNIVIIALGFVSVFAACTKKSPPPVPPNPCIRNGVDTCRLQSITLNATINLNGNKQTIHSFGASDCWGGKFFGKNWPLEKRNQMADLLFSKDFDANGNPRGIGLSLWRINVGAGSFEQGTNSRIASEWRREECFQNATGQYDFTKQAGNRWFAQAAKQRGVENLLLFSVSPPVHMTKNGLAIGPSGPEQGKLNLRADRYTAFADFLSEVAKLYTQAGMPINFISPLNEPQYDWTAGPNGESSQEGSAATNAEAFEVVRQLNTQITQKGLSTKIAFGETSSHNYLFGPISWNQNRSDVFNYFWNSSSPGFIGNMANVEKISSAHSYFSQPNLPSLISNRTSLASRMNAINSGVNFWQTEYCILFGEDNIEGNGRDLGMNAALYIARVIHTDLALANASSWHWWLGISPGDYKDGLVYVSDLSGAMNEINSTKNDGIVFSSKMLWAFGNYSRFIRPGMVRVEASMQNNTDPLVAATGLMISAYKNPVTKELVVVVINMSNEDKNMKLQGVTFAGNTLKTYTTSASGNLSYSETQTAASSISVSARSVVTFTGTYQ